MEDCQVLTLAWLWRATLFCITIGVLFLYPCPALSEQAVTDNLYGLCNPTTFTSNSTFSHNFKAVVFALTEQAYKTLYSEVNASYVYGMYQCRGDVSLPDCFSCVYNALISDVHCGSAIGARVQYKGCFVRYENYTFLDAGDDQGLAIPPICSSTQASNSLYDTAKAAPAHPGFGYNASSVGEGNSTAYALAQCLGYLSSSQCASCLSQVSNYTTLCNNSESAEVYFATCQYLFNNASFLFTTPPPPPPPPAPTPAPSLIIVGKSKKRSTTPDIVGIAVGIFLLLALIAALRLCFARRRRQMAKFDQNKNAADNGPNDHKVSLDWHTRFNIIVGIARGLSYLHEDSHVRIVHRDIKSSNILLDHNLNPKIADFGLARFFAENITHLTTRVAGTLGYLAPEYAINGQLTERADVYSFGLVALEIVSGRKVIDYRHGRYTRGSNKCKLRMQS